MNLASGNEAEMTKAILYEKMTRITTAQNQKKKILGRMLLTLKVEL